MLRISYFELFTAVWCEGVMQSQQNCFLSSALEQRPNYCTHKYVDVHCSLTVVSEETVDCVWINAGLLICCVLLIVYMQRFVYIQRLPTDVKFISLLEIQ